MANDEMYMMHGGEGNFHVARWDDLIQARTTVHTECYDNSAALYGDIFTVWDDTFRRFVDTLRGYRDEYVFFDINKIEQMMSARDAFITGDNMTIYVHSTTDETIGSQRARKGQQIARAHWEQQDMWSKYLAVREWCKSCGTAFMRIYFNPEAGKKIKGTKLHQGEVRARPLSLWQVAWDPLCGGEWEEASYVYVASLKPIEELEARGFNLNWEQLVKDNEKKAWVSQHEQYIQLQNTELARATILRDAKGRPRNILMLEYFERPSKQKPQGEYAVIIGGDVVRKTVLEVNTIPIVPFYDTKKPGTIIAQTPVKRMRPLQEALSRLASNAYERSFIPDIIGFPPGWPTDPYKFAGKAFVIHELPGYGSRTVEPTYHPGGQIRQDYILLFQLYESEMEKIAGVSSLATASPKANWSGRFGYMVTDSNKKLLSKVSYGFKKSVEQTERLILQFINKYYTEERTADFINEYDMREVVRYRGSDIGTDYTLEVSMQSNLMDDPVATGQMILQYLSIPMVAQKVISNPVAWKKATELINPAFAEKLFGAEQDQGVAEDENFEIRQGGTPKAMPWHNDDVHNQSHIRQRNSDEIQTWSPIAVRYLELHIEEHENQKMAKMKQQAWLMNMLTMGQGMMGGGGARQQSGGQSLKGMPGLAPPMREPQSIDTKLERATQMEYPGAPTPGGG